MKKPEDILKGMDHCYGIHSCNDCPYNEDGCVPALWEDGYARLRQLEHTQRKEYQKPLTLEDVLKIDDYGEAWWVEYEAGFVTPTILNNDCHQYGEQILDGFTFELADYGKTWRAWATRPTDEERAAAPWEE